MEAKMKITLKRKVQLKSAIVYLRLRREIRRNEIKDYLNLIYSFPHEIVKKRVQNYLRDKGILNQQDQLTADGIKAKETGMVKEIEEGKYQIWYTQDDPLFGNKVFYTWRIKPEARPKEPWLNELKLDFSKTTIYPLPIKEDSQNSDMLTILEMAKWYEEKREASIECTWAWNNIHNSLFFFIGKFDTIISDKEDKIRIGNLSINEIKPVDFKIDLKQHVNNIIPGWNEESGRCKMKLEDIRDEGMYQYFEYSGNPCREGYDSCNFEKLSIEPYNFEEAVIWRDKIINIELEKKFIHPDDFAGNINAINQKEGFSAYSDQFDVPDISQYIEKLEQGKKSERKQAYWHLAAPMDLNVDIPKLLRIDSFSLLKDGQICFRDIAEKFGQITAEKVFYYDKYVSTYFQQRSVSAFLGCFGVSDICIITDTNPPNQVFSDYLVKNKPAITVKDIGSVFQNRKDAPHDRFIVFKQGNNLLVWTSTNSSGFIRFSNYGEINPTDLGTLLQSITFTKVKHDIMGKQLENFIMAG
jgi:hypothetical protein